MSLSPELLEILRCPACVQEKEDAGHLDLVKDVWLVCQTCGRKYPLRHEIPVMLIEEGDRWRNAPVDSLPDTPPEPVV
ncbi:MAG TPA: Trm112 family protein [Caldilineae bacterium]|nr:Trm112 family protein [Caldilineae bacterium]